MKYNDNGTYKDIYIKALDTLPVGVIVEYSGSTIPDGWANVGNNKIQKTSQYIENGASISNEYGTSSSDGYSQEYINGIIESGGTANNYYVKYADGTMICTKQVSQTFTSVGQWGAFYDVSISGGSWASTFVSAPRVSAVATNSAGIIEGIYNPSTTGFDRIDIARGTNISSSTSWTPVVDIIAIGRWKA